jgi:hypothetical protein
VPLLGKGVLAIWNGIDPSAEADFLAWHVNEHIPERVGLTGFLRGRRYVAVDGHPKYFNFYETENTDTLFSSEYLSRLNAPTPWTRQVVAHFRDTSRTICSVAASLGRGEGGWIETIRLGNIRQNCHQLLSEVAATPGITGVHLLQGLPPATSAPTAELKLRDRPDETVSWILLIEAVGPEIIFRLRIGILKDDQLRERGVADPIQRGICRLQFSLTKADLTARVTESQSPPDSESPVMDQSINLKTRDAR